MLCMSTTCVIFGDLFIIRLLDLVFAGAWLLVLLSGRVGCSLEGLRELFLVEFYFKERVIEQANI